MKIEIKHRTTGRVLFSCDAESIKIAVEMAIKASADLSWADLRRANLSSADLSSANLRSANFRLANLSSAELRSADLRWADLSSADLRWANLHSANLSSADLDFTNIPMWCGTLKGVKVDFRLVCQMLLHIFALECDDERFIVVKSAIEAYAKLSSKWEFYSQKQS